MIRFVAGVLSISLVFWGSAENVSADTVCGSSSGKQVFWGDLHIHTAFSIDAYLFGNTNTPEDAYRYARGGALTSSTGQKYQNDRALDFAAVTDHSEYFGIMQTCTVENMDSPQCREFRRYAKADSVEGFLKFFLPHLLAPEKMCDAGDEICQRAERSLWKRTIGAAEQANEPCKFTALVANEWTATASPGELHMHRNIIYKNASVPERSINSVDESTQEQMWRGLAATCREEDGCDVLAIPHNVNWSMGKSFRTDPTDVESMRLRARFEKLVEIHQHKGSSECYPYSLLSDEACDFEVAPPRPHEKQAAEEGLDALSAEAHAEITSGYVRPTVARGLELKQTTGVNPFVYGFIGSTDNHSSRPGDVAEAGFAGATGTFDETEKRRDMVPNYNPGGLAAVWAEENTRESIFGALKRRETYGTSGPRIRLRFDQTFKKVKTCGELPSGSVAMGGTLSGSGGLFKRPPTFVVQAMKDHNALKQVDIIKLYYRDGKLEQRLHTVRGTTAGKADWCVSWSDTDYRPDEAALWYARVLEVPSPRWDGKTQIQERAWSSPIWSLPATNEN